MRRISSTNIEEATSKFFRKYGNAILKAHKGHKLDILKNATNYYKYAAASVAIIGTVHLLKEDKYLFGPCPRARCCPSLHFVWGK